MCSTHNEGNLVVAERFIKTLQGKIYIKLTANDSKPDLGYLTKLLGKYKNAYRLWHGKKPVYDDYSALTEKI